MKQYFIILSLFSSAFLYSMQPPPENLSSLNSPLLQPPPPLAMEPTVSVWPGQQWDEKACDTCASWIMGGGAGAIVTGGGLW